MKMTSYTGIIWLSEHLELQKVLYDKPTKNLINLNYIFVVTTTEKCLSRTFPQLLSGRIKCTASAKLLSA